MSVSIPLPHKTELQTVKINGYEIRFIHKPCRKDCAHLLVLFNGYRHGGWEYANSINFFKCSVLMIADIFQDGQSCYLGKNGTFEFSDAVAGLIHAVLDSLMLRPQDCTLIGPSKGGFAALYIGLKYNFKNIVAPAFVGHIGSWMTSYVPDIAKHVMGEGYSEETVARYDSLLTGLIDQDSNTDKNIYVFLSEADNFYRELGQREVCLALSRKYRNFNALFAESEAAFRHDQVTPYFLQETLSIATLLTQGIATRLDRRFTDNMLLPSAVFPDARAKAVFTSRKNSLRLTPQPVCSMEKFYTREGVMFLEGLLYLRGYAAPDFGRLHKFLKLKMKNPLDGNPTEEYEFLLGSVHRKPAGRDEFENVFFDYTAAGTATMHFKGIDLKNIRPGKYEIQLSVTADGSKRHYIPPVLAFQMAEHRDYDDYYEYRIHTQKEGICLTKQAIVGSPPPQQGYSHFGVEDFWTKDKLFHIEGAFLVRGIDLTEFEDGRYYCIARHRQTGRQYARRLGLAKKEKLGEKIGNFAGGYRACYFATMHFKGIDTNSFEPGQYDLYVSLTYGSEIFSQGIPLVLTVGDTAEFCRGSPMPDGSASSASEADTGESLNGYHKPSAEAV